MRCPPFTIARMKYQLAHPYHRSCYPQSPPRPPPLLRIIPTINMPPQPQWIPNPHSHRHPHRPLPVILSRRFPRPPLPPPRCPPPPLLPVAFGLVSSIMIATPDTRICLAIDPFTVEHSHYCTTHIIVTSAILIPPPAAARPRCMSMMSQPRSLLKPMTMMTH